MGNAGVVICRDNVKWRWNVVQVLDDTVPTVEKEKDLPKLLMELNIFCMKLKINASQSQVIIFGKE